MQMKNQPNIFILIAVAAERRTDCGSFGKRTLPKSEKNQRPTLNFQFIWHGRFPEPPYRHVMHLELNLPSSSYPATV
jgi:hypothetical protein